MLHKLKNKIKQNLVPKAKLVVLNYHQLGEVFDSKIHNKHIWNTVSLFEEHLSYLKQNFKVVSLKEGVEALKNNNVDETLVSITFDDGDASITRLVMPILERFNMPATFFINTAYGKEKLGYWYNLGPYFNDVALIEASEIIRHTKKSKEYHELLKLEDKINNDHAENSSPFYANYKALETCTNPLFHFGLHGHEHLRFSMLSREKQNENLVKNIEAMKHWPNYVPFFAVPFGQPQDWNQDTLDIAEKLDVKPLLAYRGYNTKYRLPLLRFSVDNKNLNTVFESFSPSQKTYDKLNHIKKDS